MRVLQGEHPMHGTAHPRAAVKPAASGVNAVVWIEPGRAIVVRGGDRAEPASMEAEIAHAIGDVDRVLVLGVDELRTALEREIVAIGHRPETIRDAEVEGPMDVAMLYDRLERLG
jgi:hypothetical protein